MYSPQIMALKIALLQMVPPQVAPTPNGPRLKGPRTPKGRSSKGPQPQMASALNGISKQLISISCRISSKNFCYIFFFLKTKKRWTCFKVKLLEGNYAMEEKIQGRKPFEEILYIFFFISDGPPSYNTSEVSQRKEFDRFNSRSDLIWKITNGFNQFPPIASSWNMLYFDIKMNTIIYNDFMYVHFCDNWIIVLSFCE